MYLVNRYSMVIYHYNAQMHLESRLQCYVPVYCSTVRKCIFCSVVRYKSTTYSYQYKNIGLKSENIKNIFEMLQKISEKNNYLLVSFSHSK